MVSFDRFGQTRKIRTISLDTNILSDIVYYLILENMGKLDKKRGDFVIRLKDSFESVLLILSTRIKPIGINIIRKELRRKEHLVHIYNTIFKEEKKPDKNTKQLANKYTASMNIESIDALIMAIASVNGIDIFLSWNRSDIVNEDNLKKIQNINKERGVYFPAFMTPKEFLDRIFLAENRILCLTQTPAPRRFHLQFSFPK